MPKPIQRVKFTKAIARHTKIRDQNPSLGGQGDGVPKACLEQAAADSQGSRTCVCVITF